MGVVWQSVIPFVMGAGRQHEATLLTFATGGFGVYFYIYRCRRFVAAGYFHLNKEQAGTLFDSRLPRLVSIIIAGMSLSICGLIMQQISRNKFVSPTTAGTMDWARLGILISLMLLRQRVRL